MDNQRIARELVSLAKSMTAALIPEEWMDVFTDGAELFYREAKRRGYMVEKPHKFIGGVRFELDSAGGKEGVQVVISLFKPVNKPWFVRINGWVDDEKIRNAQVYLGEDLPTPREVAKAIGKAGDMAGFWSRR